MSRKILITVLLCSISLCAFNQNNPFGTGGGPPTGTPPQGEPPCWPPPCVPIDGGIGILIAAGVALGGKKIYKSFK